MVEEIADVIEQPLQLRLGERLPLCVWLASLLSQRNRKLDVNRDYLSPADGVHCQRSWP